MGKASTKCVTFMYYRKLPQTTANAVPANADQLPHLPHSSKRMRYAVSDDLEIGGRMIEKKIAAAVREHCGGVDGLMGFFLEAADTERRLPGAIDLRAKTGWPETMPDAGLAYGYGEVEVRLGPASAISVRNYDWALRVTLAMDADDAKLVWACAHSAFRRVRGPAWAKVGRVAGMHAETVRRRFERAILELWYKLDYFADGGGNANKI